MRYPRYFKHFAFFVFVSIFGICAARFAHFHTKGFRITKIHNNLISSETQSMNHEDIQLLRHLFAYKFRYFGRGHQSFVFLSDDGEHVLKIFNNEYQTKIKFFEFLSHVPFMENFSSRQVSLYKNKLKKNFTSYELAFNEMRTQSALVVTHLFATDCLPGLSVIDALNICHRMNPNHLGFLIQKKATLVYPALERYIEQNALEAAKLALNKLIDLFIWKCQRGISDSDALIRTNFGFLGEEAIQIDVGPLSKDTAVQSPEKMREEIFRMTASLKQWLEKKSPPLLFYLEQQLQLRLYSTELK